MPLLIVKILAITIAFFVVAMFAPLLFVVAPVAIITSTWRAFVESRRAANVAAVTNAWTTLDAAERAHRASVAV